MSKQEEAALVLKIYELCKEETIRKARDWYYRDFHPHSIGDFNPTMFGEHSGQLRIVVHFWDMAAALVNDGAIGLELFTRTQDEHVIVFAKVEPFLREIREKFSADFALNLEKLIDAMPDGRKRTEAIRERQKSAMNLFAPKQTADKPSWK
jgi:hypothetical protein